MTLIQTAAALLTLVTATVPVFAGGGKFEGRGILVATSSMAMTVPGQEGHQVIPTVMDGAIAADKGSVFDNARYQIVDLVDTAGMVNGGYKTITTGDGSQLFAKYTTTGGSGANYTGTFEITGGTGQFEKASGTGTWAATFIADTVLIDEMVGEYTLP